MEIYIYIDREHETPRGNISNENSLNRINSRLNIAEGKNIER